MPLQAAADELSSSAIDLNAQYYETAAPPVTHQANVRAAGYDPNRELRLGGTMGLKLKGTGSNVKVDAFVEQGDWEMRGKFLTGENPIDVDGVMLRIERPVDWFSGGESWFDWPNG